MNNDIHIEFVVDHLVINKLFLMNGCEIKTETDQTMMRAIQMKEVQEEALRLFVKKNTDYGDKINRLMNIDNNKITCVEDETLRDTLMDLHNYSAMAIMLMDEQ